MIEPSALHGKRVALLAWNKRADGSDRAGVWAGTAVWDGAQLSLECEPGDSFFPVREDWLERMKVAPSDLKGILLDADYYFSVTVSDISEAVDPSELERTGLRWPPDEEAGSGNNG